MRALPVLAFLLAGCIVMPPRQTTPTSADTSTDGTPAYAGAGDPAPDARDARVGHGAPSHGASGAAGRDGSSGADGRAGRSTAPAAPQTVSVTIRSACPRTVPVFYGDKPRYGSGTTSSISSNSVSSKTFRVGDQMWVLDGSGNGAGSVTISSNTRNVEINASCGGISAR